MTTIQGVPDLGPGLRLHLNENTGGCSPKVVEAVRAFDAQRLATYPDFRDAIFETAAFLGVDPDRIVLTNGLDEGILLASIGYLGHRTPEALVELGAPLTAMSGTPEILVSQPAFEPYLQHRARHGRARGVGAGRSRLRVSARRRAQGHHAEHAHRLRQQPEQPERPAGAARGDSPRRPRGRATRWCSWTRRITTFSARTSWRRRPSIRT